MADEPQSIDHKELARKAQDMHKVFNPTDEDYFVKWDGYLHKVPANGDATLQWYLARKYMTEMTDKLLTQAQDEAVEQENKQRAERGEKEMEKWTGEAQDVLENKFAIMQGVRNPDAREEIMKKLYGGLVKEYGLDLPARSETVAKPSSDDAIFARLTSQAPLVEPEDDKAPIETLEDKSVFELHKIARDKGVDFEKTDKKNELISKIAQ